jgi:hypothetical protein
MLKYSFHRFLSPISENFKFNLLSEFLNIQPPPHWPDSQLPRLVGRVSRPPPRNVRSIDHAGRSACACGGDCGCCFCFGRLCLVRTHCSVCVCGYCRVSFPVFGRFLRCETQNMWHAALVCIDSTPSNVSLCRLSPTRSYTHLFVHVFDRLRLCTPALTSSGTNSSSASSSSSSVASASAANTPAAAGFRMPAEWDSHDGCWMAFPQRLDNWRDGAKPAQVRSG